MATNLTEQEAQGVLDKGLTVMGLDENVNVVYLTKNKRVHDTPYVVMNYTSGETSFNTIEEAVDFFNQSCLTEEEFRAKEQSNGN